MTAITLRQFGAMASGGASETAGYVAQQIQNWRLKLQESYALGQQAKGALDELYRVFDECRETNWDGFGAAPVSERTFELASDFLRSLPLGTTAPSLGAEPDGHLTLEWYRSPRRILSVSISPEGDLHYAALIGAGKSYGTEPFYGEVPEVIVNLIRRVLAA